jgi:beta-galactosidase/beta-glucuronidase
LGVTLGQDGTELARHALAVGIRTIALDQSPDPAERGTRFFRCVLNGVPIFARGTDWIPADSFVGAIEEERYEKLLGAARDANMNMLRVWGGGIYGNVHNWEVWHGNFPRRFGEEPRQEPTPENVSFLRYAEDSGRFISEFGMHASPVYETLRRAIPKEQLYYHSPSMDHHNKDDPKNNGDNLMLTVTGLPKDLDEYMDFSMIAQAEGLKFGIEHFRRRKPHCSGTLF